MKRSIEWHQQILDNQKTAQSKLKVSIELRTLELKRMTEDIAFYERQLTTAKDRHLTGFDSDRFLLLKESR